MLEKKFIIRCKKCRWAILTTGISKDLEDEKLLEIKNNCTSCSGRFFRCQNCGDKAKIQRIK